MCGFLSLEWLPIFPDERTGAVIMIAQTPSCNHPIAVFAQSKRLPLIWDELGLELPAWRALLPETPRSEAGKFGDGWIYKPALGRGGRGISIREALTPKEYRQIQRNVRWHPKDWIVQKRFESKPVSGDEGKHFHLCVGVFTVDGKLPVFMGASVPFPA